MKKLIIIVSKGSALDSYLSNDFYLFDKITRLDDEISYQMFISNPLDMIDYLISIFEPQIYSTTCKNGRYIFRVRS